MVHIKKNLKKKKRESYRTRCKFYGINSAIASYTEPQPMATRGQW